MCFFFSYRCEYVLQQKGPQFVHQIVARNPNLRRPSLYNPANVQLSTLPQRRYFFYNFKPLENLLHDVSRIVIFV